MTIDEKKILAAATDANDYAECMLAAMSDDERHAALAGRSLADLRRDLEADFYLHSSN